MGRLRGVSCDEYDVHDFIPHRSLFLVVLDGVKGRRGHRIGDIGHITTTAISHPIKWAKSSLLEYNSPRSSSEWHLQPNLPSHLCHTSDREQKIGLRYQPKMELYECGRLDNWHRLPSDPDFASPGLHIARGGRNTLQHLVHLNQQPIAKNSR